MTDPFRAERTAEYIVRENRGWAADERLARVVQPRASFGALIASLTSLFAREAAQQPRPEPRMLPRRERPAA